MFFYLKIEIIHKKMLNLRTKIIPFTNQLASIKKAAFSSTSKLAGNYGPNGYNFGN